MHSRVTGCPLCDRKFDGCVGEKPGFLLLALGKQPHKGSYAKRNMLLQNENWDVIKFQFSFCSSFVIYGQNPGGILFKHCVHNGPKLQAVLCNQ
jgi:hypothetical protein